MLSLSHYCTFCTLYIGNEQYTEVSKNLTVVIQGCTFALNILRIIEKVKMIFSFSFFYFLGMESRMNENSYDYLVIDDDHDNRILMELDEEFHQHLLLARVDSLTKNVKEEYLRLGYSKLVHHPDDIQIMVIDEMRCIDDDENIPISYILYKTINDILDDKPPKMIRCTNKQHTKKRIIYTI